MSMIFPWLMVAATILLTTYGQLVLKWQVGIAAAAPFRFMDDWPDIVVLLLRPWVISALAAAFLASLCWMAAMSRLELSKAYPFMALNFVLVCIAAVPFFGETFNLAKGIGLTTVIIGLVILSQG